MLRAVVFLAVPLFKGTLALMALPYAALGVRAGAVHCTMPAGPRPARAAGTGGAFEGRDEALLARFATALQVNL